MNLNTAANEAKANQTPEKIAEANRASVSSVYGGAYNEMAHDHVRASTDVLVQLRSNLSQLEELHSRLRFVMAEISYLLKRD